MRTPQRPAPAAAHEPDKAAAPQQSSTHDIDVQGEVVTKRYRSWNRREPHREWAALTLLAEHAPDLSPAPISADWFRRLLALGWLLILGPGGPSAARNPPGTLKRQAGRVLALLDS